MLKINFVVIKNVLIGNIVKASQYTRIDNFSSSNGILIEFLSTYDHSWIANHKGTIYFAGANLDKQCLCLAFDSPKQAKYYMEKFQIAIEEFNNQNES